MADAGGHPERAAGGLAGRDGLIGAGLCALALATRLNFLRASPDRAWPHSVWLEGDAPLWARWAGAIARGELFEWGLAVHPPGVAYLLWALGCSGSSPGYLGAKVLWCVVGAMACGLTYLAARTEVSRGAAALAALLVAFSFSQYLICTSLNGEALYTALLPVFVIGTLRAAREPSALGVRLLGLAHGGALLIRPEHTLLMLMLLGLLLWERRWDMTSRAGMVRNAATAALVVVMASAVCLPWSLSTARATGRFNTVAAPVDFGRVAPRWSEDARAAIGALPAFARADNVAYLSFLAQKRGLPLVSGETVRDYFQREFGYTPEPLSVWHLVSGKGGLDFALANAPGASGGFSKRALDARFGPDPALNFSMPSHLYLYNHGYRAGTAWMREDPGRWAGLAARKLAIFSEGAGQGFTSLNLPLGREGVRRPVDMFTAGPPWRFAWWGVLGFLFVAGAWRAARMRVGGVWALVIIYKLLVTVAFYGYARQSASILPAFAFFVALGLEAAGGVLLNRVPAVRTARGRWLLWSAPVLVLLAVDVWGSWWARPPVPVGNATPAPQWGPGAFEAVGDLEVRAR